MAGVCAECIDDPFLKEEALSDGEALVCSECATEGQGFSVEALAKRIEPLVRQHFIHGEMRRVFVDPDDDYGEFVQDGDSLDWVVQQITGQYFSFQDELVSEVVSAEDCWPPDGDEPFVDDQFNYVEKGPDLQDVQARWDRLVIALKHERRFFNVEVKQFFDVLFADLEGLVELGSSSAEPSSPIVELAPSVRLYRCRYAESFSVIEEFFQSPASKLGAPPAHKAAAGRMNPEGIPVLYTSLERDTAFAEMRPALGARYVCIQMQPTRALRVLDFRKLERARSVQALSYFQQDFEEQVANATFLRRLHGLIARPIAPGHEADYVITQAMVEYLTRMRGSPLDGVLFASAQRATGANLVLVSAVHGQFPVEILGDTVQILETETVESTSREIDAQLRDGRLLVLSQFDDGW